MLTFTGTKVEDFHYPKIRVTRKGIDTNPQVLGNSKNTPESYAARAEQSRTTKFAIFSPYMSFTQYEPHTTTISTLVNIHTLGKKKNIAWNSTWNNRLGHLLSNIWRH